MQWLGQTLTRVRAGLAPRGGSLREVAALVGIVVACLGWRLLAGGAAADAAPKQPARAAKSGTAATASAASVPEKLMAMVNGVEIGERALSAECLARHGAGVVETLVNKAIIDQA